MWEGEGRVKVRLSWRYVSFVQALGINSAPPRSTPSTPEVDVDFITSRRPASLHSDHVERSRTPGEVCCCAPVRHVPSEGPDQRQGTHAITDMVAAETSASSVSVKRPPKNRT